LSDSNADANAWLGSKELKEEILHDLADDLEKDRYVQGSYLTGAEDDEKAFYGCHVGCLMVAAARYDNRRHDDPAPLDVLASGVAERGMWHDLVVEKLGMPRDLAQFWDKFYEQLPASLAPRFAVESLRCVPVGADLRTVLHQLITWLLGDEHAGFLARARPGTAAEQELQSYLVVFGAYWAARAQDYTRPAHVGLGPIHTDELAEKVRTIGADITDDVGSPFYWAAQALRSAASGTATHHVAGALICEWVAAIDAGAMEMPRLPLIDPFEDEMLAHEQPWWLVAAKFFQLCAAAPQGPQ
jgi:hypothetical protein